MRSPLPHALTALAVMVLLGCFALGPDAPPASMDRAIGLDAWVLATSPGIEIASAAGEQRTLELARELQIFRALARTLSQAPVEPRVPTRILVFPDRRAYVHFGSSSTAGEFHESLRGFVLAMSADDPSARHTLFHEYVHFLLHNQSMSYPTWYDEGFAELLGGASIREHVVTVGALVGREATLANEDRLLPLETLLGARAYADAETRIDGFYAQSWLLAHLLILGHHAGYPQRVDSLRAYLAALQTAPDWRGAFDAAFPEGLDALAGDLESYRQRVTSGVYLPRIRLDARKLWAVLPAIEVRPLAPADVAAELGAAYLDRETDAARYAQRLFERALERDPGHVRARAGLARARALLGAFDDAHAELARAEGSAPRRRLRAARPRCRAAAPGRSAWQRGLRGRERGALRGARLTAPRHRNRAQPARRPRAARPHVPRSGRRRRGGDRGARAGARSAPLERGDPPRPGEALRADRPAGPRARTCRSRAALVARRAARAGPRAARRDRARHPGLP